MNKFTKTCATCAMLASTLVLANPAAAQYQLVMGAPQSQDVGAGENFVVAANYMALPDEGTTGLGLMMFWNSSRVEYVELGGVLNDQLLAVGEPEPDMDNVDGDGSTDMLVHVAWADWLGNWPGQRGVVTLYNATFTNHMAPGEATKVNFTASHTPVGYAMTGYSATAQSVENVAGECAPGVWCDELDEDTLWAGEHPWDIDGDGRLDALTDGIAIVRWMFGFRDLEI